MSDLQPTDRFDHEERLRQEIETARQEIAASILAIRRRVVTPFDWRAVIRRRPVPVLLGGVAVGITIALLTGARRDET
ncbi:MAG TPA: hypothetical protein VN033_09840 [Vulgatibacter sp.]|nr:hypothetical protein [Vulgatibacter sp.]